MISGGRIQGLAGEKSDRRILTVAVISHKPYRMPTDPMYMPLHVGAALHPDVLPDWVQDNTGDNISDRNAKYSELTGLYWLWKNDDSDYQGIVHYRRHFGTSNWLVRHIRRDRFSRIVSEKELLLVLEKGDIVLPRERNYIIESVYGHYAHTFAGEQLDLVRKILVERQPEYVSAFDRVMSSKKAHMFNMFVMSREKLERYCSWLFPILEELEHCIDDSGYDAFNKRYPGRISEMLMDVWIGTRGYGYNELPVVSPEPINWGRKMIGFLLAKFGKKKYSKSF